MCDNDDDLRTALTKLAVKYENLGNDEVSADAVWCDLMNLPWPARPAPVSDTRREDVAREMGYRLRTVAAYYRLRGRHGEVPDPAFIEREIQGGTDCILAALPAQPVVDEAEVRERIAQDIEASILPNDDSPTAHWLRSRAANIARGATR